MRSGCRWLLWFSILAAAWGVLPACSPPPHDHFHEDEPSFTPRYEIKQQALIDCRERQDTGYVQGRAFSITVVTVDGKPVEKSTANAYYVMQQAAASAGVAIRIVSGFRTMSEQQYLYNCYRNCNCNNCNLAATPGYSNHQSGHALDLNTSSGGVYNWLAANAGRFGFKRTVPSEPWHWEWWGGGPGGGPCGSCKPSCNGSKITDETCGVGDCGAFGATCVNDSLGVRCVSVFCPAQGSKQVCLNDKIIGTCNNGAISTGDCSAFGSKCVSDSLGARCVFVFCPAQGKVNLCLSDREIGQCENGQFTKGDCGAFGAYCSIAGTTSARCVSVFCVASPQDVPKAHDVCLPNGDLAHCDNKGGITVDKCPAGKACADAPLPRCIGKAAPRGRLDKVACNEIEGWAQDTDTPSKAIDVHLYFGGPAGTAGIHGVPLNAGIHRADLCTAIGSCSHSFSLYPPQSLFNNKDHPVHAYGIDSEGGPNTHLANSPLPLKCPPTLPSGIRRQIKDGATFDSWKFSVFWDVLPAQESAFSSIKQGPPLPSSPTLVKADDGTPHVWLIDGAYRRHVPSATIFGFWRFDWASVKLWPSAKVYAYVEGTPWRTRPTLVEDSKGFHSLFDDEQKAVAPTFEKPIAPENPEQAFEVLPEEDPSSAWDKVFSDAALPEVEPPEPTPEEKNHNEGFEATPPEAPAPSEAAEKTTSDAAKGEILHLEKQPEPSPWSPPPSGCRCSSDGSSSSFDLGFLVGLFFFLFFLRPSR